ncbi:hypothetical protein GUJ93_ZPchr0002g23790 [Zizania palustris]|uniref:Uncharacterized protein n=1 Tax=Zizania palustris TaxID=103762 RepID=A0A8J5SH24_ZIZPA|nr:hypothetical protein GUJ93_ZPchr0002g23790 [Zizania palustris]
MKYLIGTWYWDRQATDFVPVSCVNLWYCVVATVEFWAQCSCTRIAGRPPAHEKPGLRLLLLVIRHGPLLLWRCHSPIHSLIHAELQLLWWPGNHLCKAGWVRSLGDYLERLRAVLLLRRSESVIGSVSGSGGLVLLL